MDRLGIPSTVLSGIWLKFIFTLLAALHEELDVIAETTRLYNLQPNSHVKRLDATMISKPVKYAVKHEKKWDMFLFLLTHSYNKQVHHTTKLHPFFLENTRLPREPATIECLMWLDVSEIDLSPAYGLRPIGRSELLRNMADQSTNNA